MAPLPKRSTQRRRAPKPGEIEWARGADDVEPLEPDPEWHPIARQIYDSLEQSGQSRFFEPSDWAIAYLFVDSISRDLKPQYVGVTAAPHSEPIYEVIPLKGASLSAYLKAFGNLLMTEGDRRRLRLELERGGLENPDGDRADATVTELFAVPQGA